MTRVCLMLSGALTVALCALPARGEGLIYVASTPAAAQIVVDGKLTRHKTPSQLLLPGGLHTIGATKAGHSLEQRRVKVIDGKVVRLQLTLSPAAQDLSRPPSTTPARRGKRRGPLVVGSLTLITDVPGADITVDGKPTGLKTPITARIPVGRHTIRLSHGTSYVDQTVTIHKGNNAQIRVNLKPGPQPVTRPPAPARPHKADPAYPAWRHACLKQCKHKNFVSSCDPQLKQCTDRCPGKVAGRIVNPGYYHPCADTCRNQRQYCLESAVSACKQRCGS